MNADNREQRYHISRDHVKTPNDGGGGGGGWGSGDISD